MSLNGIDISDHQRGIDLAKVPCDFVIVKATEGADYKSPSFEKQYNDAKRLGKKLGIYHYANGTNANAEARYFLNAVGDRYKGAVLCLDWENGSNSAYNGGRNLPWVQTWMDAVEKATGKNPLLYCSPYLIGYYAKYKDRIWAAQYASNNFIYGYQNTPWNEGAYSCRIRQYSGAGILSGYPNKLDLDKFYGSAGDWDKMISSDGKVTPVKPTAAKAIVPRLDIEINTPHHGRSGKKQNEVSMSFDQINGVSIGTTGGWIEYRVHVVGGGWLGKITKCDWKTPDAYAGDLKRPIDAIQMYFHTDTNQTGGKYYSAEYSVMTSDRKWLGTILDTNWENGDGNHTAGIFGKAIVAIRAKLVA